MGISSSHVRPDTPKSAECDEADLIITGLGTEWPSKLIGPQDFRDYTSKLYSEDMDWLVLFLLEIKRTTALILIYS
jgi:hypothetical protein